MRLPWRRRRDDAIPSDADEALELSEQRREQAVERRAEFDRLAERMRRMRTTNHLAERFAQALREGRR
ncbi:DUF7620 family protein [Actinomadura rubrisoli]|uniref:Uncharacterized protein n=1 Tax=Actinomadura rubrisoli TaxID=2530368 RepID=A0A4R5CDQ3_9ACTN|nr:hypothetical protein [Actinomadura rubrisoli]TDD97655.1 hypothetical protein E1298_01070 [Actinomadura rubrisoli]